jgi:hypothetical protein
VKAWANGVFLGTFDQASGTPMLWGQTSATLGIAQGVQFEGVWLSTALFKVVLADADRETVRAWFRAKWGL